MSDQSEPWEEDLEYLSQIDPSIVYDDELEEAYCLSIWELFNMGFNRKLARMLSYRRVFCGHIDKFLESVTTGT